MARAKVISDAAELVPLLRAFDSKVKRNVFSDLTDEWVTESEIEDRYGEEGVETLGLLENAHLVETRWATGDGGPEKAYHSFYTDFHFNVQSPVDEIGDLLHIAAMDEDSFKKLERELVTMAKEGGVATRKAQQELDVTTSTLRGLVKRSAQLEIKGHEIVHRG